MDAKVFAYLSSINPIAKKIARQEEDLRRYLGSKWDDINAEQRDELLDELAVGQEVREGMVGIPRADHIAESRPVSFPKLSIPSGERIMVDFENDLRTWRDEFSGPFSWKSRSQQDLTLADLEGENLTKPPAKSRGAKSSAGGDSESSAQDQPPETAQEQFQYQGDQVWAKLLLEEYRQSSREEPAAQVLSGSTLAATHPEVNQGFQASCEDLPQASAPNPGSGRPTSATSVTMTRPSQPPPPPPQPHPQQQQSQQGSSEQTGKSSKKSPIKRLTMSPTFSRSAEPSLLEDGTGDQKAETAFTNPALESEWGTFVGQEQGPGKARKGAPVGAKLPEPPAVPRKEKPVAARFPELEMGIVRPKAALGAAEKMAEEIELTEPRSQQMSRGGEVPSDHSVESTPDHTTSLIKPSHRRQQMEEAEEVLTVTYTEQPTSDGLTQNLLDESNASSLRSGFDFLDNW